MIQKIILCLLLMISCIEGIKSVFQFGITWHGLPVDESEIEPLSKEKESAIGICWKNKRKKLKNLENYQLVLEIYDTEQSLLKIGRVLIPATFQPATEELRTKVQKLPKSLDACYSVVFKIPQGADIRPEYDYQPMLVH